MKNRYVFQFVIVCVLLPMLAGAQSTMYYMDRLPQIQQYNPALMPKVNFFLNLPGIGHQQIELNNSGFKLGQFLDFTDQLGTSNYDPDEFINSIGEFNQTTLEARTNFLSFGFKLKKNGYFSMGLSQRTFLDMTAPSEIVYLLDDFEKIDDRLPVHIDGVNLQMNTFTQLSFTLAKNVTEKLTLGITPKLIGSLGGLTTEKLTMDIEKIGLDEYDVKFDGKMLVGLPVPINPAAIGSDGELDPDQDILEEDWLDNYSVGNLFQNPGLAIDLGANYQITPEWSVSASLIDLGRSSWRKNAYHLSYDLDNSKVEDLQKLRIKIPAKFYLGANYLLSPFWNAGFLYRNVFNESKNYHSATLSLNGYVGRMLSTSVSYTAGQKFNNLGFGLRLRFLPGTDFYVVTDNMLNVISYRNIQYSNVAVGINLALGVRQNNSGLMIEEKTE